MALPRVEMVLQALIQILMSMALHMALQSELEMAPRQDAAPRIRGAPRQDAAPRIRGAASMREAAVMGVPAMMANKMPYSPPMAAGPEVLRTRRRQLQKWEMQWASRIPQVPAFARTNGG